MNAEIVENLAAKIVRRLSSASKSRIDTWIRMHGLGRATDPLHVLGVQAVLNAVARLMLYREISDEPSPPSSFAEIADTEARMWGNALKPYSLDEVLDEVLGGRDREFVEGVAKLAKAYDRSKALNDYLGELYERLIPNAERRRLGQFFTPIPVADLMVKYVATGVGGKSGGTVVDPAVGTGRFIIRLLHQDPSATEKFKVVGIDISPLMLVLSAANLSYLTDLSKLELKLGDMFDLADTIRGSLAVVCNPPYSRHHELGAEYKEKLQKRLQAVSGLSLSKYTSIFGYALPYLASLLARGGLMSFICPVEVFEAKYSGEIKRFLVGNKLLERVIVFDERSFVFPYAENAVTILFLRKDSLDDVYFLKVRELRDAASVVALLNYAEEGDYSWFFVRRVSVKTLAKNDEWKLFYSEEALGNILSIVSSHPLVVPLRSIAKVMRGIATGANDFFILSDAEVRKWNIKEEYLRPALVKTRWVLSYVFDRETFNSIRARGEKCMLLYCTLPPEELDEDVRRYIKYGEELGLPKRSLIRLRKFWYQVERRDPPPIVFTYLSRGRPRFIYNEVEAIPLNTFLCVYPVREISSDRERLKALLAYLNSNIALELLRLIGRSYGGSTLKLEPRELDELPVLDVRRLDGDDVRRLAELFDKLKHLTKNDDEVRKDIDVAVLTMLKKYRDRAPEGTLIRYIRSKEVQSS